MRLLGRDSFFLWMDLDSGVGSGGGFSLGEFPGPGIGVWRVSGFKDNT